MSEFEAQNASDEADLFLSEDPRFIEACRVAEALVFASATPVSEAYLAERMQIGRAHV